MAVAPMFFFVDHVGRKCTNRERDATVIIGALHNYLTGVYSYSRNDCFLFDHKCLKTEIILRPAGACFDNLKSKFCGFST